MICTMICRISHVPIYHAIYHLEADRMRYQWFAYPCHSSSSNQVGWWVSNAFSFVVSVWAHVLAGVARIRWHATLSIGVRFSALFCSHSQWTKFTIFKIYPDYCEPASDKPFSPSVGCRFDLSGFLVSFTFSIKVQDYAKLQLVDENGGAVLRLLAESGQWSRGLRKHT